MIKNLIFAENNSNNTPFSLMKRILFFLAAVSLVAFTSCDETTDENNENAANAGSVYGTWVSSLTDEHSTLVINENGTGSLYREEFTFTYDGKLDSIHIRNVYQGIEEITSYKVSFLGDIMTWSFTEENGYTYYEVWYKEGGNYSRKVTDARYDLFTDASAGDTMAVYIFKGNKVDLYIIAWGEHLSGTFTHENGVLTLNITEGKCLSAEPDHRSWFAPGLDPETLEPYAGYEWYDMMSLDEWAAEQFNDAKDMFSKMTFVLTSDNEGYGQAGRPGKIRKH